MAPQTPVRQVNGAARRLSKRVAPIRNSGFFESGLVSQCGIDKKIIVTTFRFENWLKIVDP